MGPSPLPINSPFEKDIPENEEKFYKKWVKKVNRRKKNKFKMPR